MGKIFFPVSLIFSPNYCTETPHKHCLLIQHGTLYARVDFFLSLTIKLNPKRLFASWTIQKSGCDNSSFALHGNFHIILELYISPFSHCKGLKFSLIPPGAQTGMIVSTKIISKALRSELRSKLMGGLRRT